MNRRFLLMVVLMMVIVALFLISCASSAGSISAEKKGTQTVTEEKIVQVAKDVLAKNKDAIVMVRLVLKVDSSYGGRSMGKREQKVEANGTIVDPSGLTIISYGQTDPGAMLGGFNIMGGGDEEEGGGFKMESEIAGVKIVLNDGKEYPASIILQDKDLDLAFVRPDEKGLKLPYIKLEKTASPEVLEQVVTISRLGFDTGREPLVTYGPVMTIIKKPRTHYVVMGVGERGCPAFNTNGQCLGLMLQRKGQAGGGGSFNIMSFMPAVLPTEDIIEVMKQVPPPKEKEEEKK